MRQLKNFTGHAQTKNLALHITAGATIIEVLISCLLIASSLQWVLHWATYHSFVSQCAMYCTCIRRHKSGVQIPVNCTYSYIIAVLQPSFLLTNPSLNIAYKTTGESQLSFGQDVCTSLLELHKPYLRSAGAWGLVEASLHSVVTSFELCVLACDVCSRNYGCGIRILPIRLPGMDNRPDAEFCRVPLESYDILKADSQFRSELLEKRPATQA